MKNSIIRLIGTCLLLVLLDGFVHAQQRTIPLSEAISQIEKKFKTKFAYEHNLLRGKSVSASALTGDSVEEILKNVLYPNNLLFLYVSGNSYSIVARDARFFQTPPPSPTSSPKPTSPSAPAYVDEDQIVRGNITTTEGVALPFANVWVKGTRRGTTANEKGNYNLSGMKPGEHLVITFVGYKDKEVVVSELGTLNIIMEAHEGKSLNEVSVVSTGYQALPKERATGAFGSISAKEIEKIPTPNLIQRLEGQVPGLDVQLTGGDNTFTYANTQFAIASGTRTVGRSDYNLAIRGISTSQGEALPLIVVDGAITTLDLKTFNPRDIENITVLKDAAAASIWGTRAANGVIVITTKKGNINQGPRLNFSTDFMTSGPPRLNYLRLMSVDQTIDYEQEAVNKGLIINPLTTTLFPQRVSEVTDLTFQLKAGRLTQAQYDDALNSIRARGNGFDQISQYILQPTANQQYNLSLSGGGLASTYFYSASYSKERPNTRGTNGQRLTLTLNNSFKVFDKITISTNLKASMFKYKMGAVGLNSLFSPSSITFMPYDQLVDANGKRLSYARSYYDSYLSTLEKQGYLPWRYNYLDEMDFNDNSSSDNNYLATINVNVPLFKGLSANGFFSNERSFAQGRRYNSIDTYATRDLLNNATVVGTNGQLVTAIPKGGTLNQTNTQFNNYSLRGQLAFNQNYGTDHQINAIAGTEIRQTMASQGSSTMYGYYMDRGLAQNVNYAMPYSTLTGGQSVISGGPTQEDKTRRFLSYYANASYTLKNRYTLSGSVRYDDYNNFGVDRSYRATPLWSTGLKWNLDQEHFLKNLSWINSLGLRTTYGVNGNIATDMYPFTSMYLTGSDPLTTNPAAGILNPANPTLRWEKTYVYNVAVDFGLFNRRLNGSIDFYTKQGRDIIYEFPINPTYGISTLKRNTTSLSGKGVDVGLKADVIRKNDWGVQAGLTFAYNTNQVTDTRFVATSTILSNPTLQNWMKGYTTDKLLVYRFAGLDATGMTLVYNENGEKLAPNQSITSLDALKHVGRLTAPYFGGFNATIRYKGFSLYALATYSFGNVFIKPTISSYPTALGRNAQLKYDLSADIAKRWKNPGDELTTNVPGMAGTYAGVSLYRFQNSDLNVLPGDFIRLREVSLTYQVAERFAQLAGFKGASLGVAVRNLGLIWTKNKEGFDPVFANSLSSTTLGIPPSPSYTFSLNVNF
ncbi:SusC/RagA family TonB-linked outer membrane protein [Siphonobacter sp. SORGH_AS_1065]|uniref:SusC/RagA family TonB-linked outer membrane protein n=1 Tax=Siphonobacter sp. SORGH_AS_1065 TaxID=3041795 RepID=UPI0027803451|nr:SusC/RagA family TonB-linked outer membrane protein [Siphonobacter sp. SORGH_AS_1065]MDQ1090560.1 TonB-linked SusC/RagA family outer membrane protein [Siphonobacter sp. SORGH_AS_1065]